MRGFSAAFGSIVKASHTAVCKVDVIQNDKIVRQLDVHGGSMTADRTAAQLRSFEVKVSDPDGTLTPASMASLLAPFGTRLQLWRGVQIPDVTITSTFHNTQPSWVSTTPTGVNNGTVGSATDGALVMGP